MVRAKVSIDGYFEMKQQLNMAKLMRNRIIQKKQQQIHLRKQLFEVEKKQQNGKE